MTTNEKCELCERSFNEYRLCFPLTLTVSAEDIENTEMVKRFNYLQLSGHACGLECFERKITAEFIDRYQKNAITTEQFFELIEGFNRDRRELWHKIQWKRKE